MSIKELIDANNEAVNHILSKGKSNDRENLKKELLIGRVILEIEHSFKVSDVESVFELLGAMSKENLIAFLPEDEWNDFE